MTMNPKPRFKTPDEAETVFYEAFERCDRDVMAALCAEGEVVCIHPGSAAITGHDAVVRSWAHILGDAQRPDIRYTVARRTEADGLAVHLVVEEIAAGEAATALVLATNVYRRFDTGWLMIEHHASLVQAPRPAHTVQ